MSINNSGSTRKSREIKRNLGMKTMGIKEQLQLNERKEKMKKNLTNDTRETDLIKLRAIGQREIKANQGTGLVDNNEAKSRKEENESRNK